MKIENDKYYTPQETAQSCIDKTYEICNLHNIEISQVIEPSAGNGSFLKLIPDCIGYDIEPEDNSIIKADFLKLDIDYQKGRLIIGNPPFGERNNLARSFFKKSVKISDVVGFILPITQLNNSNTLFDFDLVESIDLGIVNFSDSRKLHCCFNIYIRPKNGLLNKSNTSNKSDLFKLFDKRDKNYDSLEYDFCIIRRGSNVGKITTPDKHNMIYKVLVFDKNNLSYVKDVFDNEDLTKGKSFITSPYLTKVEIYQYFSNYGNINNFI